MWVYMCGCVMAHLRKSEDSFHLVGHWDQTQKSGLAVSTVPLSHLTSLSLLSKTLCLSEPEAHRFHWVC